MKYHGIKKSVVIFVIWMTICLLCACNDNSRIQPETDIEKDYIENVSGNTTDSIIANTSLYSIESELKIEEADYEANMDIVKGVSQAIINEIYPDQNYIVEEGVYQYSGQDISECLSKRKLSLIISDLYYSSKSGNEILNQDEVIRVVNSAFGTSFTCKDIEDSKYFYVQGDQLIRDDYDYWKPMYLGEWDSDENKYYIELCQMQMTSSRENEEMVQGYYYPIVERAIVEFSEADNELGFTVVNVEFIYNNPDLISDPWYLYDIYNDETKFIDINEINWGEYGFFPSEDNKIEGFLPVLEQTSTVQFFTNLNYSQTEELYIEDIKIGAIGVFDLDQNGYNEMIMSVYKDNEWRIMIISHINDKYYGYIFEKYGCLAMAQNGLYYSTDLKGYGKYFEVCKLNISAEGFSEDCILTFSIGADYADEIILGDTLITWAEYREWIYENMGAMVPFWNVQ